MSVVENSVLRCSFCNREFLETENLIIGDGVVICGSCVLETSQKLQKADYTPAKQCSFCKERSVQVEIADVANPKVHFVKIVKGRSGAICENCLKRIEEEPENLNFGKQLKAEPDLPTDKNVIGDGNLVNINGCSEEELAALPGIGIIKAKQIVLLREQKNGFISFKEFVLSAQIQPHHAVQLENLVAIGKFEKDTLPTTYGSTRLLDI